MLLDTADPLAGRAGRSLRETAPRWDFGYTFVAILMAIACAFFRACHEQELDCRRLGRARSARSKQRVHASLARQVGAASPHRAGRPSRILFADRRVPWQRQAAILHGNRCRERGRSISSRHGRRILPVPSGCHLANGRGDTDPDASRAAGVHERQQELGLSTPLRPGGDQ